MKILQFLIINLFIFNASSCIKQSKEEPSFSCGMQWDSTWDAKAKKAKKDELRTRATAQSKATEQFINQWQQNNFESLCDQTAQLYTPNAIALLENGSLTKVQVDCFELFTQTQWEDYLKYSLKLENSPQVFQFHILYQFSHFRQAIQSLSDYDQAMVDLYNRLDYSSRTFDRSLYDSLEYLPTGLGVYECLNNSSAVHARIVEQGAEFADRLSKRSIEDQIEQIRLLEEARGKIATNNNIADQLKLELLNQQIAQSKHNIADWESKLSQSLSEKPVSDLPTIRMDILSNIDVVDQQTLAAKGRLNNAVSKMDHTNHREQQREIQRIHDQQALLNGKRHCLHKQLELVQAHEYLAQNQDGLHSQERLGALQGKTIQSAIVLTPQAQKLIQDMGVNAKLFSYTPRTPLEMQSQQEVISLINKLAEQKGYSADAQICDATAQIARTAMEASRQGDIAKSWAWVDVGNSLLDAAECIWNCSEALMESAAQRLEVLSDAAADALCHPVQAAQQIMNTAVNLLKVLTDRDFQQRAGKFVVSTMYIAGAAEGGCASIDLATRVADIEKAVGILNEMTEGITPITLSRAAGGALVDYIALGSVLKVAGAVNDIAAAEAISLAQKTKGFTPELAQAEKAVVTARDSLTVAIENGVSRIAPTIEKEFFAAAGQDGIASSSLQGAQLNKHLYQLEEYGKCGIKELQNGSIRYYDVIKPANTPGKMAGSRWVREWSPEKGLDWTKTWIETLDHQGIIRIIRVETGGPKVHYMFDEFGKLTKIF